jgi:hypothetical protein
VNEQGISLREALDGEYLRFTFRRIVDERLIQQWLESKQIAKDVQYEEGDDCIVWQYSSSGKYPVQTLRAVINNRGVRQVVTPRVKFPLITLIRGLSMHQIPWLINF